MTKINQALQMAQALMFDILYDENGAYKFRPTIRASRDMTVYTHSANAAIERSQTGLEWRFSAAYRKQYYQVRTSSLSLHIFTTLPSLCTWLENETLAYVERESQKETEKTAQARADEEGVTVYAVRAGNTFFTATLEEIARDHAEDSIQIMHTATPPHKPTGEEIAADAQPGDTIVWLNCNAIVRESTFKRMEAGRGVIAEMDGEEIGIRFDKIRGLKKAAPNNELKDGKDVANDAKPGDILIYEENGAECEGRFYDLDAHGAMVWNFHNVLVVVKFDHILGLKKSGSTPDPDQPASEQPTPDGLTDQEYTALQQKIMSFDPTTGSTDEILKDMATLHHECDRRTMEFHSGKRTRRSVQSKQMIACRDALQVKLGYRISLNKRGVYARSTRQ